MKAKAKVKVVFLGREVLSDSQFSIVKIGEYEPCQEDCIRALKDGILDKYKSDVPEFEVLHFEQMDTYDMDGKRFVVFVFVCNEIEPETKLKTLLSGKATFSSFIA